MNRPRLTHEEELSVRKSEMLSHCEQTTIKDPLLKDLLVGDVSKYVPGHVNLLANGHGRNDAARHILCFIIRKALGIVRLPGSYDLQLRGHFFKDLDSSALENAVTEARRIYRHTQNELQRVWGQNTIPLVRGTRDLESSAIDYLLNKLEGDTVPLYLNTLTFFNHEARPFVGDFTVSLDCPVEWVWANEYTVELVKQGGTCEEFIVACTDPSGMIEVPRDAFKRHLTSSPFTPLQVTGYLGTETRRELIGHALAELVHDGLEPDDTLRYSLEYAPGKWERRAKKWGKRLIEMARRWDANSQNTSARVNKKLI